MYYELSVHMINIIDNAKNLDLVLLKILRKSVLISVIDCLLNIGPDAIMMIHYVRQFSRVKSSF